MVQIAAGCLYSHLCTLLQRITWMHVQGPMRCQGGCAPDDADVGAGCFECYKAPGDGINIAMDLGNARCAPSTEMVPTFTTHNRRICLLLATGEMGNLRIEDAERLQVCSVLQSCVLAPLSYFPFIFV